jgi:hypothetical protein
VHNRDVEKTSPGNGGFDRRLSGIEARGTKEAVIVPDGNFHFGWLIA